MARTESKMGAVQRDNTVFKAKGEEVQKGLEADPGHLCGERNESICARKGDKNALQEMNDAKENKSLCGERLRRLRRSARVWWSPGAESERARVPITVFGGDGAVKGEGVADGVCDGRSGQNG